MTIPNEGLMMKMCRKCKQEKEMSLFYKKKGGYLTSECKECTKARTRERYHGAEHNRIKALSNAYGKKRHARIKNAVFAAYGGYVCACCGEKEEKFLSLDHIHNNGADFRRMIAGTQHGAGYVTYRWLAKNGFPSGYQILCMNCNHGKRMNHGVCPHQATRNDHPLVGVEPSGSKRTAPILKVVG